jgi:hypothetical protein
MTGYIVDLSHSVKELQDMMLAFVGGQYVVQPPQPSQPPPSPPSLPPTPSQPLLTYSYGGVSGAVPSPSTSVPPMGARVPIHQLQFPPSPSPIPS